MNHKIFFFKSKIWWVAELLILLLLASPGAWASETRSDAGSEALEQGAAVVDVLSPEVGREALSPLSALPRSSSLEAVQGAFKSVLNTALETVQSNSLVEAGMASWYGSAFQGHRTASGERFDMNQLTAAHKTLPLGTVVQVRNPLNGKTVDVTINDRGPFIKGRIIDLSYRAALALGIVQAGRQPVEVHRR